ncbi:GspE/PulE family protein [Nitrincola tapanii]|uniref:Type II/IV secretion system protein n=1 Tax=Nitrincola tapanii TaxID=1708751 RepID=A0A5A9W4C1_9GAMM|nr:GspE/PulE family protein [Nitrincola tapanii]KAA0874391.1 type II/IV secretion system protein [Nitrincola tapanii]
MSTASGALIGEVLLAAGAINMRDLDKALVAQREMGGRLGTLLVRSGAVSETQLLEGLRLQLGLPLLEQDLPIPTDVEIRSGLECFAFDPGWWLQEEAIVWLHNDQLYCFAQDCFAPLLNEVLHHLSQPVIQVLGRRQLLETCLGVLRTLMSTEDSTAFEEADIQHLRELAEEAPVVELVNNTFSLAMEQRASDIHIEPEEDTFDIRYRIDGVLYTRRTLPKSRYHAVASRLKLVSGIDIAERRLPQDGRISMRVNGQEMDIRVSSLPGVQGESIVMRLLPKERRELQLDRLGFLPDHLQLIRSWAHRPHGIVLVTGPTGSGKSTTLYSTLDETNDGQRKIITVEDPVEFQLPHVTQVQVHSDIGMTFARALRAILRQDPDVIMIGEIRDLETAEIAVQSALTGHLVLSTLHTNDALSAFTRLIDMGIEPFLAATPVIAVQAQRLVRRLCPSCSVPATPSAQIQMLVSQWLESSQAESLEDWREAVGCAACQHTGFSGRVGIYELVEVSEGLREKVLAGASVGELQRQARMDGFRNLYIDGLLKARMGLTSVDEVLRVTSLGE